MSQETLQYHRGTILQVLRNLNQIVVSLDRIGSASVDMDQSEADEALASFIRDWEVFGKLSHARRVLSAPFSSELGPDEVDELEREMQDVIYWSMNRRVRDA